MARYEVRRARSTGAIAVIDTIAQTVARKYDPDDTETAFNDCDLWNELDNRFNASEHTAASFAAQWRKTVRGF